MKENDDSLVVTNENACKHRRSPQHKEYKLLLYNSWKKRKLCFLLPLEELNICLREILLWLAMKYIGHNNRALFGHIVMRSTLRSTLQGDMVFRVLPHWKGGTDLSFSPLEILKLLSDSSNISQKGKQELHWLQIIIILQTVGNKKTIVQICVTSSLLGQGHQNKFKSGTAKIGVWGLYPQRGSKGQSPLDGVMGWSSLKLALFRKWG